MTRRMDVRSGELKAVREQLSLTTAALAALLRVSEATVKNWEKGKYPPPAGVAQEIERLEAWTSRGVQAVVDAAVSMKPPMVLVWRLTDEMPPGPAKILGAPWWRSVAARARTQSPAILIGYADELDEITGSREKTLTQAITPTTLPPAKVS